MGVEAFARWNGRTGAEFLDLIRALGQVRAVDEAVLRIAAAAATRFGSLPISVNVDRQTLSAPGFVERLRATLDAAGLPPDRLVLELNDLEFGKHDPALAALAAARELGVQLAVDDFGAGSATLRRLRELQPAIIKVDGSLVDDGEDPQSAALLAGTAQLGRLLGAIVVAEGVETRAQRHAAARAGCAGVQGFLMSPPLDAEGMVELLGDEPVALSC
jgi:EAL domain-containing protein (putative c-di-GMP-specific phosphodiesterase class I)